MIRWITNYLGTAPWEYAENTSDVEVLDIRDLVDGAGNSNELVAEKIKIGTGIIQQQKKLIVCCEFGMSRSNAIAVGIICTIEKISFNEGLKLVLNSTKEKQIKLSVLKVINKIIAADNASMEGKREKILIIDHDDHIGRSLANLLSQEKFVLLKNGSDLSELLINPALLYLFVKEKNISGIAFISCQRVVNTNQFVGDLLVAIKNILDVSVATDCYLFLTSTIDVFLGCKKKTLTIKPTTNKDPHGNKGIAYSLAEDLAGYYKKDHKLNVTVLRIPVVYGEHATKPYFIANFIRKARSNREIKIHRYLNNLAWVNLIHVNDLARFMLELITKEQFGTYNIDGGERLNTSDISRNILKACSSKSKLAFVKLETSLVKIKVDMTELTEKFIWRPTENFYQTIKNEIDGKKAN